MSTQSIQGDANKDVDASEAMASAEDPNKGGISFKNIVYNVGSSVFGGFGSFAGQSSKDKNQIEHQKPEERAKEPKTRGNVE